MLHKIGAVSELTGVPVAKLRAWQNRYGVPALARTASSHRLYTDADVALVKVMRDLIANGLRPAEAAEQIRANMRSTAPRSVEDPYTAAADRIVDATTRFDALGVEYEVDRALLLGSALAIFDRAIGPALARIGELWHAGTLSVSQEHLASQIILGRTAHLMRLLQPTNGRRALLAAWAEEEHVIGLYGVALHLATWGYRSVYLGPRTPPQAIADAVEVTAPHVVGISITTTDPATPHDRNLLRQYEEACVGRAWVVGGQGAEALRPHIQALGGLVAPANVAELRKTLAREIKRRRVR